MAIEIRLLRADDDRTEFRSGHPALDYFFRQYAGQNQFRHHIGSTYVAMFGGRIEGFATVCPCQIDCEKIPSRARQRLPNYPLPALRLARLAVSDSAQGSGIGSTLLRYVFRLAREMGEALGCIGVLVDAKPEAVEFYGALGFEALDPLLGAATQQPVPMLILLSEIA